MEVRSILLAYTAQSLFFFSFIMCSMPRVSLAETSSHSTDLEPGAQHPLARNRAYGRDCLHSASQEMDRQRLY